MGTQNEKSYEGCCEYLPDNPFWNPNSSIGTCFSGEKLSLGVIKGFLAALKALYVTMSGCPKRVSTIV